MRLKLAVCLLAAFSCGRQIFGQEIESTRQGAVLGDAEAQFILGGMYDYGFGVPVDDREAVKWYRLAAE